MPTVLISAPYMMDYLDRFEPISRHYGLDVVIADVEERLTAEEILRYAGQFDGAICGDDAFNQQVISACLPRLKVISKWGTGIDSIDKAAADEAGIMVGRTPNAFTLPVADTVFGYMLAFARQQPWMDRAIRNGDWAKFPGRSLSECTIGVVGVGNIGKAVLRRGRAFGSRLLGNDIVPVEPDFVLENGVEMTTLADLLGSADFITLHTDLNPTSYHLMNPTTFRQVRRGAVLINTSRGPVVEEAALIAALQSGRLGGAALDVFEVEPLPLESPLRAMDNVMLGSHNANCSPAAFERVFWNTVRNLLVGLGIGVAELDDLRKS